jgi:hypothetical protein
MAAKAGDRLVMLTKIKRVAARQRAGVIEAVLDERQPRYSVRWDDGRTTVIAPVPGSVEIRPAAKKRAAPKKAKKT